MLSPKTLTKYFLIQIPGWLLIVGVGKLMNSAGWIPNIYWGLALGIWIVKDIALYPILWKSFSPASDSGDCPLIGKNCIVLRDLNPEGTVRVQGEIWQATLDSQSELATLPGGSSGMITRQSGIKLIVSPLSDDIIDDQKFNG